MREGLTVFFAVELVLEWTPDGGCNAAVLTRLFSS
jgi:hypothetical protein